MKSTDDLVYEFQVEAGQHIGRPGERPDPDVIRHRIRLIKEEFEEVEEELRMLLVANRHDDPKATQETLGFLLKELCDLRYVLDGTAVAFGLPYGEAYREVHRSNMSKRFPDGTFHTDAKGKVIKGPNYEPANMARFVPPVLEHEDDH